LIAALSTLLLVSLNPAPTLLPLMAGSLRLLIHITIQRQSTRAIFLVEGGEFADALGIFFLSFGGGGGVSFVLVTCDVVTLYESCGWG
jgi:hypothetical protein